MLLNKNEEIIAKLKKIDSEHCPDNLQCWIKQESNYKIHVFSIQLKDEAELLQIKDDLRDYLAIYFQSQTLEKNVERWNIYQVFLVQEPVSKEIKQQIEQDKFATRKLVIDDVKVELDEIAIERKIYETVFQFSITNKETNNISLIDSLGEDENSLLAAIEQIGDVDTLLKYFENEQNKAN